MSGYHFTLPLLISLVNTIGEAFLESEKAPVFKSIATTIKTREHDTVLLPCYIDNLGSNRILWWRGDILLAESGREKTGADNIRLFRNNTLEVGEVSSVDTGQYTCQVIRPEPWGPIYQHHAIQVLYPPTARMLPDLERVDVQMDEEVNITCDVTGVPYPLISWTFKGEEMKLITMRKSLSLKATSEAISGEYACIASNSVGDAAVARIFVRVIYAPIVTASKMWINSAPGLRTELFCDIEASPPPTVEWLLDKKKVERGTRIVTSKEDNKYGLIILNTKKSDFGYYTCVVWNSLGRNQRVIQLSGLPDVPGFKENYIQKSDDNVTLAWTVDSHSPIMQYNLLFRDHEPYSKPRNWSKLIIPAEEFSNGYIHSQTYTLTGLKAATHYEASVQARNAFGWSKPSLIVKFSTLGAVLDPYSTDEFETNTISDIVSAEYIATDNDVGSSGRLQAALSLTLLLHLISSTLS